MQIRDVIVENKKKLKSMILTQLIFYFGDWVMKVMLRHEIVLKCAVNGECKGNGTAEI